MRLPVNINTSLVSAWENRVIYLCRWASWVQRGVGWDLGGKHFPEKVIFLFSLVWFALCNGWIIIFQMIWKIVVFHSKIRIAICLCLPLDALPSSSFYPIHPSSPLHFHFSLSVNFPEPNKEKLMYNCVFPWKIISHVFGPTKLSLIALTFFFHRGVKAIWYS